MTSGRSTSIHRMRAIPNIGSLQHQIEELSAEVNRLHEQLRDRDYRLKIHESLDARRTWPTGDYWSPKEPLGAPYNIVATISLDCRSDRQAKGCHIIVKESVRRAVEQCDILLRNGEQLMYDFVSGAVVELRPEVVEE